jgi:hypothetical protein
MDCGGTLLPALPGTLSHLDETGIGIDPDARNAALKAIVMLEAGLERLAVITGWMRSSGLASTELAPPEFPTPSRVAPPFAGQQRLLSGDGSQHEEMTRPLKSVPLFESPSRPRQWAKEDASR